MDTKKLRQKILDLAIHGKLVPQDPNDEPASVLLERIREEKGRLIKEGKIKKSKSTASSDTSHYENVPFEVPEGWCWTTIHDICSKIGSGSTPKGSNYSESGIPFFRSQNVHNDGIVYEDIKYISEDVHYTMRGTEVLANDVLLNITGGSLGRCAVVPSDFVRGNVSQHVCILRTINVLPEYLQAFIISDYFSSTMILSGSGREGLPKYSLEAMLIPIPPLSEQERIVAELTKVFLLVDAIDEGKQGVEYTISQVKSKILDLAIHGKLVPQDVNDEPASELLKRINPKAVASCDNPHYDEPYELPNGWQWMELGKLAVDSADGPFGSNLKKEHYTQNKEVRIIQLSNIGEEGWRDENTKYTTFEHLTEISRSEVKAGDVVIAKMMPAGRAILCPNYDVKYVLSSDAVKFVLPVGICNDYVLNAINSSVFREQVYDNVQGVTRVRTSLQKLRTYVLPIPPYNEQLRIVSKVRELFSQIDMIKKSLQA